MRIAAAEFETAEIHVGVELVWTSTRVPSSAACRAKTQVRLASGSEGTAGLQNSWIHVGTTLVLAKMIVDSSAAC